MHQACDPALDDDPVSCWMDSACAPPLGTSRTSNSVDLRHIRLDGVERRRRAVGSNRARRDHPVSSDTPRRGEIWMVDLANPVGAEAAFERPAVIVSNNAANESASAMGRGVVAVLPITGNIRRVYPFQVRLTARSCGLSRDSKAQAEQVRAIAFARLRRRVGQAPQQTMNEVEAAMRLHLAL